MIQVGSFQRYQDADRVTARLALAGVSAGIQRVVINGSDFWYRVRIGPFNDLKSLQGARQRLTEGGFNYTLLVSRSNPARGPASARPRTHRASIRGASQFRCRD